MVKSPLILKEYVYPIESTRKLLMEETSQNIKGTKKFSFKKYLTEKERLKQYFEQRKHFGEIYDDKGNLISRNIPEKKVKKTHTIVYEQPRMRFKPRTELERIVDSINDYNYGKINNDLIRKQFKSMEMALMKQKMLKEKKNEISETKTDSDSSYDNNNNNNDIIKMNNKQETTTDKASFNQSKQNFYRNKPFKRNLIDNSVAKKLMEEYHYKTHFKAAAQLADKYTDETTKQKRKEIFKSAFQFSHNKPSTRSNSCIKFRNKTFYKDNNNCNKDISTQNNDSVLSQFASKFPLREENFDLVQANPLLYNLNFHSFKSNSELTHQQNNNGYSMEEKLAYLKNLSFNYAVNEEESAQKKKVKFAESIDKKKEQAAKKLHSLISKGDDVGLDFNKDDKIWVNDEAISLGQMELIALKVLKNCNYVHKKNVNNNKFLRKGDGMLMMTSGLSINEFTKKYNLN